MHMDSVKVGTELPTELVCAIFSALPDLASFAAARSACQAWRECSGSDIVWQVMFLRDIGPRKPVATTWRAAYRDAVRAVRNYDSRQERLECAIRSGYVARAKKESHRSNPHVSLNRALCCAAKNAGADLTIIEHLLLQGADVNFYARGVSRPFFEACWAHEPLAALALVQAGSAVDAQPGECCVHPLVAAASAGDSFREVVRALLDGGADPDGGVCSPCIGLQDQKPVVAAICNDAGVILDMLLASGVSVHWDGIRPVPLLHTACRLGAADCAMILLAHGAMPEYPDCAARSLALVCDPHLRKGRPMRGSGSLLITTLVEAGAQVLLDPLVAFLLASKDTCDSDPSLSESLGALLMAGASVNASLNGASPLHIAITERRDLITINMLLAFGANVNATDGAGDTPLHLASRTSFVEAVECLLAVDGVQVYMPNNLGQTALAVA